MISRYLPMFLLAALILPTSTTAQTSVPSALTETYENWKVSCVMSAKTADSDVQANARKCEMLQELAQGEQGQRILAVGLAVGDGNSVAAELTAIAPLGVALSAGVSLVKGKDPFLSMPFTVCVAAGCVVRAKLSAEQMSGLEGTETLSVNMVANTGTAVSLPLSLAGFSAAWSRLKELTSETDAP